MKWILMQIALLAVTVTANKALAALPLEGSHVGEKNPADGLPELMESAVDSDKDVTFDSVGFCASRYMKRLHKTKKVVPSPLRLGVTMAGLVNCVALVDTVLFPWNVYKEMSREFQALTWKKADFRSFFRQLTRLSSTLMRSIGRAPFRSFYQLVAVITLGPPLFKQLLSDDQLH